MKFITWLHKPLIKQSYCHIKQKKNAFQFSKFMVFLLLALYIYGLSPTISTLNVVSLQTFITGFIIAYRMLWDEGHYI
jgi:hypothetical protein